MMDEQIYEHFAFVFSCGVMPKLSHALRGYGTEVRAIWEPSGSAHVALLAVMPSLAWRRDLAHGQRCPGGSVQTEADAA